MSRKRSRRVAPVLAIMAGLLLGLWLARTWLPACLGSGRAGPSAPVAVLSHTARDLGTVSQGAVLRTTFPVTNAGTRRLILIEQTEPCCGESAGPRHVILAPGDSTELDVEVDSAQWFGRMEHTVHYTTNDPRLPRFALRVSAIVESPPSPDAPPATRVP